jgi:bacterioferritin
MKPRDPRIVHLLNDALTYELTITNTYFLHSRMLDSWGFPRLGKIFYDLSIDEMRDADSIIQRILMFDGHPNVQRLNPITIGEDAEEILTLGLAGEVEAVRAFNAAGEECRALGDHGTASIFDAMVRDEEAHGDWFEAQLQAIKVIGIQAYLAQQVDPTSTP